MNRTKASMLIALFFVGIPVAAVAAPSSWGFKCGYSAGHYHGSDYRSFLSEHDVDNRTVFGPAFALFVEIGLQEWLAIQTEIGYMERGGSMYGWREESDDAIHLDIIDRYSVVEIPVYLKPRITMQRLTLYGLLGSQISLVLFDAAIDYRFDDATHTEFRRPDNRTLLGAAADLGCTTGVGSGLLGLEFLYSRMFTSAFNEEPETFLNGMTVYLTVGRLF